MKSPFKAGNVQDKREIIIIAAMAENRVIGKDGALPWSLKADMAHFRELTSGWPCVMGRKTWESLPRRPLPGRLNVVVSGTMREACPGVKVFPSLAAAVEHCFAYQKIFICGGASIYREALSLADRIELTLIRQNYEGDTFFPEIDARWTKINSLDFDTFSFVSYVRERTVQPS
ncbi:MAG: dihydrofolate reductase [Treponema sp.]|nr:dihydrofolate reductase [Treponema sp.]